jgi:hypothetical protein
LSIQFVVKLTACLALAGASLMLAAQQSPAAASSDSSITDSSAQAQPQNTAQQPASSPQAMPPSASAQQSSSPQSPAPQASDASSDKNKNGQTTGGKVEGTSNDRLFYTLPNFLTLEKGGKLPPLSAKDKFKVVALGTFDYVQYPWWGLLAAISQADNSEPAYGQGWLSYAKRYGTTAADSTIENFMVGAVFPSILHQDPRFYYSEQGGTTRRTWYAISRIFVSRSDYLRTPTNPHLFVGSDRTLVNATSVWGTQVALDTITLVIKEFWPDIHHKMAKKHEAAAAGAAKP